MPRKLKKPKASQPAKQPPQLARIEAKVDHLVSRVDKLDRRASMWGTVGGALTALLVHLAGCF